MSEAGELLQSLRKLQSDGHEFFVKENKESKEHIIKFSDDLQLSLEIENDDEEQYCFCIEKILPDGLRVRYLDDFSTFCDDQDCYGVEVVNNLVEFYLIDCGMERKEYFNFKNLTPSPFVRKSKRKYSAEYDHIHLLPLHLYKYTNDERILKFFQENNLVETIDKTHQTQFLDAEIETV